MDRREFVKLAISSTAIPIAGCTSIGGGTSEQDCDSVEVIRSEVVVEGGKTSTPGTDTPPPEPAYEDYILVIVENQSTRAHTLVGYVETYEERKEYSRDIPAETGTFEFRFGPFGHHTIDEFEFQIVNC